MAKVRAVAPQTSCPWTLRVGGYRAEGQLVWGATARTLAMFASVLRHA